MSKTPKVIELPPEQFQQMVEAAQGEQAANDLAEQLELQALNELIKGMKPDEIADYLADHLSQTDIIIESLNLVSDFTAGEAVFVAALNRARRGIDAAVLWIENQFSEAEKQAKETLKENKTESPKQQKEGKRIVYGTSKDLLPEDDSEQL